MKFRYAICLGSLLAVGFTGCGKPARSSQPARAAETTPMPSVAEEELGEPAGGGGAPERIVKSDAEWREKLTAKQYEVTRRKGTERAFTGDYWNNKANGVYNCVCCANPLFSSKTKFESGTGWPSFYEPVESGNVATNADHSFFTTRWEVVCSRCDAHLGHVFDDGPAPTHLRYCINSVALTFEPAEQAAQGSLKTEGTQP